MYQMRPFSLKMSSPAEGQVAHKAQCSQSAWLQIPLCPLHPVISGGSLTSLWLHLSECKMAGVTIVPGPPE